MTAHSHEQARIWPQLARSSRSERISTKPDVKRESLDDYKRRVNASLSDPEFVKKVHALTPLYKLPER